MAIKEKMNGKIDVMTLSDLKDLVKTIEGWEKEKQVLNPTIWIASDEEGNSFGQIAVDITLSVGIKGNNVILYPINSIEDVDR